MDRNKKEQLSNEFAYLMELREKQRTLKLTKSFVLIKEYHLDDIKRMLKMRHLFQNIDVDRSRRKKIFELYMVNDLNINSIELLARDLKPEEGSEISRENLYQIIFEEYCLITSKYVEDFRLPPLRRKYGIGVYKEPHKKTDKKAERAVEKKITCNLIGTPNDRLKEGFINRKRTREIDLDFELNEIQTNTKVLNESKDEQEISIACKNIEGCLKRIDNEANDLKKEYARLITEMSLID